MPKAAPTHKRHTLTPQTKGHTPTRPRIHNRTVRRDTGSQELHRSNAWRQFSISFRRSNPICKYCNIHGKSKLCQQVDHIIPHNGDPDIFWMDDNYQALCASCHGYKRTEEANPTNLPLYVQCKPAWCVVISGPPASGKTTEAERIQAERDGIIYDLDDIAEDIGLPRYGRTWEQAKIALHHRNHRLMQHPDTHGLILIQTNVTAPQRATLLTRLGASFVSMTTPNSINTKRLSDRHS